MMRRTSTTAVIAAMLLAALTACSSDSSDTSTAADTPTPTTATPAPSTAASTPTPSPTGPCADGTCEVEVEVGDKVNVPDTYGLGPIEVRAISDGTVEMAAPLTGTGYSISGCSGGGGVSSAGGGGVGMSCDKGTVATINDVMSLEVVTTTDTTAVLRIGPTG
ncbi:MULTISPECIES: hypothetical protein [unclassified Streptomyces]|uniref:hypothetical protein n=1 Tax=unclassified Streptomyces TaxID=2593676 RepID=UPI001F0C217D|nr:MULTISPECIES: hypothetical protein [unclassified Streptomyces]